MLPRVPRVALALLFLLLLATGLPALSYISIETGQMLLINPLDEGGLSPILTTAGAAIPLIEVGVFRLELSTLFWGTQYYLGPVSGRPLPAQWEAKQFTVLGMWIAPLAGVNFQLAGGKLELGAAATLALNFRLPLFLWDIPAEGDAAGWAEWDTIWSSAATYFFQARFLYPETDFWIRWRVAEDLSLALTIKALYPIFQLWNGNGFSDEMILAAVVGFDIRLPPREAAAGGGSR